MLCDGGSRRSTVKHAVLGGFSITHKQIRVELPSSLRLQKLGLGVRRKLGSETIGGKERRLISFGFPRKNRAETGFLAAAAAAPRAPPEAPLLSRGREQNKQGHIARGALKEQRVREGASEKKGG